MRIGIVGAGALGLTIGYELSKFGHKVTIFESESYAGGLISKIKIGKTDIENFYHHIFTSDTDIIDLIEELGLSNCLSWFSTKSGIYINNRLYSLSTPFELLAFKELTLLERLMMGLMVLKSNLINDWKSLENITAKEWIIKNSSENVYSKIWKPLLRSKFGCDSSNVSAVWIWNKFKLRGSSRSKNKNNEVLGYMKGSFGIVYDKLSEEIIKNNGKFNYSSKVRRILEYGDKIKIITDNKEELFDKVVVTTAPKILKQIANFSDDYNNKIDNINYKANICMVLELKNSLSDYYWITVAQESSPFVLVIEHTNLISRSEYDSNIVYLSRYIEGEAEMFSYDDKKVFEVFCNYLRKIFPEWNETDVISYHVNKSLYSQPTIYRNYSRLNLDYKTPIKSLYTISMSSIYPEDRGQNYAIKYGRNFAKILHNNEI